MWVLSPKKSGYKNCLFTQKTKPRNFGGLKELLFSGVWFCLDCWILCLSLVFLVNWIWSFGWILISDVKLY